MYGQPPARNLAPAASRARRTAILLLAGLTALALALLLGARGALEDLARAACRGDVEARSTLRLIVTAVVVLVPASGLGIALYLGSIARRVKRARLFPPPGTALLRPVKQLQGPAAERRRHVLDSTKGGGPTGPPRVSVPFSGPTT